MAGYFGMNYSVSGKYARLQSRYSQLSFSQDSRIFKINGLEANLSFAVAKVRNELLLAQTDFQYFIDPILRRETVSRRRVRHILLDPGHGGNDPGAQNHGVVEKNVNLVLMAYCGDSAQAGLSGEFRIRIACCAWNNVLRLPGVGSRICFSASIAMRGKLQHPELRLYHQSGKTLQRGNVFAKTAAPGNAYNLKNALLVFVAAKLLG